MNAFKKTIKKLLPDNLYYSYLKKTRRCYSQFGQDLWVINEVFNKEKYKYFVEIGSADGITFNNTFLLESKYKWQGICIEANFKSFGELVKNRKCLTLNKCLSDIPDKKVIFHEYGLDSGILSDSVSNKECPVGIKCEMTTDTLFNILKENNAPEIIDYLSVDVEGEEENILINFPFNKYKFQCMTIERPSEILNNLLIASGYIRVKEIPGVDVFYIHSELQDYYRLNIYNHYRSISKKTLL